MIQRPIKRVKIVKHEGMFYLTIEGVRVEVPFKKPFEASAAAFDDYDAQEVEHAYDLVAESYS